MNSNQNINLLNLLSISNSNDLFKKKFNFNKFYLERLFFRLEINYSYKKKTLNFEFLQIFSKIITIYFSNFSSVKKRKILNILFLFLVSSYNGYRHFLGLPTNGQRTWSNKKTARKLNSELKIILNNK